MTGSSLAALMAASLIVASSGVGESRRPPMHPKVKLLDRSGRSVTECGGAVSTSKTCGGCHDTSYIAGHSYHAMAGSDRPSEAGQSASGRPWDANSGLSGRWDPLSYGPVGTAFEPGKWVKWAASRHVGGGPAERLGVEMDCFLCHLPAPDHESRQRELRAGRYEWAATATLSSTGAVRWTGTAWKWDPRVVDAQGECDDSFPRPRATTSANCGLCHGLAHSGSSPAVLRPDGGSMSTETKGQIYAAQMMKDSGLNLEGKDTLARPFDIHAERLLQCADCHSTINNPAQYPGVARAPLAHLTFEPRRLTPGEYLARPDHHLAKGHTPQGTVAREFDGTMRRCEDCHDADAGHRWLPYLRRHLQAVNCESCHVPQVYAPAREQTDWTLIRPEGGAVVAYRGSDGDPLKARTLQRGFRPALLPREELSGSAKLTPHNVITTWYWVAGDPPRPVELELLKKALYQGDDLRADVKALLDIDGDGVIEPDELRLDSPAKADPIRRRLESLGLKDPRIRGEIQPYSLHHGVATGSWAVRDCAECHGARSRVTAPIELARYLPGGVLPAPVGDANTRWDGEMAVDGSGRLMYRPATKQVPLHVIGLDRWRQGDVAGVVAVFGTLLAVLVHGGLRVRSSRKGR